MKCCIVPPLPLHICFLCENSLCFSSAWINTFSEWTVCWWSYSYSYMFGKGDISINNTPFNFKKRCSRRRASSLFLARDIWLNRDNTRGSSHCYHWWTHPISVDIYNADEYVCRSKRKKIKCFVCGEAHVANIFYISRLSCQTHQTIRLMSPTFLIPKL